MSKGAVGNSKAAVSGGFDPTPYVREGVTAEEVLEIKTAFDLFDADKGGLIEPKGKQQVTQRSRTPWTRSGWR